MNDDAALLQQYAGEGSQDAFTRLVRRHVDFVYGVALRRTGDPHRAADVAQQVFTTLARDARKLTHHPALSAWLHTATRNAALNLMISEKRRRVRETEAIALDSPVASDETRLDWDKVGPVLDAAIDELPESHRTAVILRFLERRPFAEIGARLRVSEDAARMRTDRALEKLRAGLARRGITSTAAALGVIASSQPVVAAPAGLAATLASQSLTAAAGAGYVATTFISLMNTKVVTTAAISAILVLGTGLFIGSRMRSGPELALPQKIVPDQSSLVDSLRRDNRDLRSETTRLRLDIAQLKTDLSHAVEKSSLASPLKTAPPSRRGLSLGLSLRQKQISILNNLRQISAARDQFIIDKKRPPTSVHELIGIYIRTIPTVDGEDYTELSMAAGQILTTRLPDGTSVTLDPSNVLTTRVEPDPTTVPPQLAEAARRITPTVQKAITAYAAARGGALPSTEQDILPFFATPQEAADFLEFAESAKAAGIALMGKP